MAPHRRTDATRRSAVVATLAAVIAAVLGGTVDTGTPAQATPERCDGVWVVVDARVLDGPTTTRCVPTERPIRGIDALTRAGHTVSDVPGQPGFVCRIDRRPDPCPGTPPPDAYWSYWLAEPGGTWRYSQFGAANREAAPGTVDAWAFGAGDPPSIPPPRPAAAERPDRDDGNGSGSGGTDSGPTPPRSEGPSTDTDAGRSGGDADSDRDRSGRDDRGADTSSADATGEQPQAGASRAEAGDDAADDPSGREPRDDDTDDEGDGAHDRARPPSPDRVAGPIEEPSDATEDVDDRRADDRDDRVADDHTAEGEVLVGRDGGGGSLGPVALGGGLLAGLAATAAWTSRRRGAALDPGT